MDGILSLSSIKNFSNPLYLLFYFLRLYRLFINSYFFLFLFLRYRLYYYLEKVLTILESFDILS